MLGIGAITHVRGRYHSRSQLARGAAPIALASVALPTYRCAGRRKRPHARRGEQRGAQVAPPDPRARHSEHVWGHYKSAMNRPALAQRRGMYSWLSDAAYRPQNTESPRMQCSCRIKRQGMRTRMRMPAGGVQRTRGQPITEARRGYMVMQKKRKTALSHQKGLRTLVGARPSAAAPPANAEGARPQLYRGHRLITTYSQPAPKRPAYQTLPPPTPASTVPHHPRFARGPVQSRNSRQTWHRRRQRQRRRLIRHAGWETANR